MSHVVDSCVSEPASDVLSFAEAIKEALTDAMVADARVVCFGLGVGDPKEVFGTTAGLQARFGTARVFDMPASEAAMTGVAIGAALADLRPVLVHQRLDFCVMSMDALVNQAAKWRFMSAGRRTVPLVVRCVLGRGWGQGPTHAQAWHAWFCHVPGLKVVMPTTPADAKGLLLAAIADPDPVLFLEHRWLHASVGPVPRLGEIVPLGRAACRRKGTDISLVAMGYMTVEALQAAAWLARVGIECEVLDLRTLRPLDWDAISATLAHTGRLLVADVGPLTGSLAGEIVARVAQEQWSALKCAPERLALPDAPEPTSFALTEGWHPRAEDIVRRVIAMLGVPLDAKALAAEIAASRREPHDVPGTWFKGPF
ncbi:alpha-ketoacid dehydrogenase subunit beta [Burkholderia diffusa]|uniref:alpha-ketoacid dehydrogenase subunit beta n=1 Tax=Burkholderia diffusa TaxID=488732 RepID=UPI0007591944|nr:transketolase C-terminal domain-containing protein [Burkholderia diffusa]KVN06955.1 acetoin dehydrogenase [Burkholderia diffusa]